MARTERRSRLWESGAILIYLGGKDRQASRGDRGGRYQVLKWLMFQMGGVGPMFGQLGFFVKFAGAQSKTRCPRQRYIDEARRLLAVVEGALEGRDWIAGDYSIADIALAPWLGRSTSTRRREAVGWNDLKNTPAYLDRFMTRPAVQKGRNVPRERADPARGPGAVPGPRTIPAATPVSV
jgi:GST-like protein